jgi:hypothetical protein
MPYFQPRFSMILAADLSLAERLLNHRLYETMLGLQEP